MKPEILERLAIQAGMVSLLNLGAASCVHSEGCSGVTQQHLDKFAELVAVEVYLAMSDAAAIRARDEGVSNGKA